MSVEVLNKEPLISVVIPTYNRGYIIRRSIDSVLNQTYKNLEILVVDDCSTDNTDELLGEYNDPRLHYIKQTTNQGSNAARNRGIEEAKGEYIAFQDSDDEWLPNKLEVLILAANNSQEDYGAFFAKTSGIKFDGSVTYFPVCEALPANLSQAILQQNYICTVSLVVKKTLLLEVGSFDNDLPRLQDWDLAIRLSKVCPILFVNEVLVNAYHQKESISADGRKLVKAIAIIRKKYNEDIMKLNYQQKALVFNKYGSLICKEAMVKEGRKYLIEAFKCQPWFPKNLMQLILSFFGSAAYRYVVLRILGKKLL